MENNKNNNTWITSAFDLEEYKKLYPLFQNRFNQIEISIASPKEIEEWSSGQVLKSETVNYKTGKGEKDGLFCEKIFGPMRNYECACGKYKKAQDRSIKQCEVCGVLLTDRIVRRLRMGHIDLAEPVVHIWYFKVPGAQAIATLLDGAFIPTTYIENDTEVTNFKICNLKNSMIESLIYYQSFIMMDMGDIPNHPYTKKALKPFTLFTLYDERNIESKLVYLLERLKEREKIKSNGVVTKNIELLELTLTTLKDGITPFNLFENLRVVSEITGARFVTGSKAIKELLTRLDLEYNLKQLKNKLSRRKKSTKTTLWKLLRKIEIYETFVHNKVKPEWMVLEKIPVLPADLRPMITLDGGRYSTTEINDLYRNILIRNNKVIRMRNAQSPKSFIMNSLRLLQEAVDTLIDNKKRNHPAVSARTGIIKKSLADVLLGKTGRFRQNLLGKRVDFSGRSVITVGPKQKLYQCGLPKEHALELYKPFIISNLIKENTKILPDGTKEEYLDIKNAEKLIEQKDPSIWNAVFEALKERPVLLNRAPTLHKLGIQAFEPILVEGRAIQLHPLATVAFNADFDGDQMAVHLPLSAEAISEARTRMLGSSNILGPKDGKPITVPSQDMTLGLYYLTIEKTKANYASTGVTYSDENIKGEGMIFASNADALSAYENGIISLHAVIGIKVKGLDKKYLFNKEEEKKILRTTIGKIIFNQTIPIECAYINDSLQGRINRKRTSDLFDNARDFKQSIENSKSLNSPFNKKFVTNIVGEIYSIAQEIYKDTFKLNAVIAKMLDELKDLGFKYSTESGISIGKEDVFIPKEKKALLEKSEKFISSLDEYQQKGWFSKEDYTTRVVRHWNETKASLHRILVKQLSRNKTNSIYLMADSGARGTESNFTQLMGMRGIMTNPQGEVISIPVKSCFKEGLSISEFFISTHGARKGNVDTAMKTGVAGYMTRIFIDSCQNVIVETEDCGTQNTYPMRAITEKESATGKRENIIVPLQDRIFGRVAGETITKDRKILVKEGQIITREIAENIVNADIEEVRIYSVLTGYGVSQKCYGLDLGTNKLVELHTAVGVIAAQAIGEPGTQLTLNTFHTGGVAGDTDITQGLPLIENIVKFQRVGRREVTAEEDVVVKSGGVVTAITDKPDDSSGSFIRVERTVKGKDDSHTYYVRKSSKILVKVGDELKPGQRLTEGHVSLFKIWKYAGIFAVYDEILQTFHKVYRIQGIEIADKYFEIVIKQMTSKMRIISSGDTKFIPGQFVDLKEYETENARIFENNLAPAYGRLWILSSVQSSLLSDSFLWAVSFQETTQYLAKAALKNKKDYLKGLKENVIFGNLIPVGTGKMPREDVIIDEQVLKVTRY